MLWSILDHKVSSSVVDFFQFLMLFGSPAMLIIVLCTTNGEREEIVSSSISEWIIKDLGT